MNQSSIALCGDNSFGPTVQLQSCRDGFDFTLLFEDSIFAILPSAILVSIVPIRFLQIYRKGNEIQWPSLRMLKLGTIGVFCALKLVLLILWTRSTAQRSQATIAAGALDLASALSMGLLSPVEHAKSLRPSPLLNVFLFTTVLLDGARARTEWLISTSNVIPSVFLASLAVKIALLVLEAYPKGHHAGREHSPEATSGIFSLSLFSWLNPLIYQGNRGNLTTDELSPLDAPLAAEAVVPRFQSVWESSSRDKYNSLAWATAQALRVPLLVILIPRGFLIGFSIAQPFLIEKALNYVAADSDMTETYGYGLIGAYALTYLGIAISTAWYQYLSARALAMIRAALISTIFRSLLSVTDGSAEASHAASLMGADVERIVSQLQFVLSTAANIIQVALAAWILKTRLGAICVAPFLIALASAVASNQVAKLIRPRQREWMQGVQKRVGTTSDVLGAVKGMKMLGFTGTVTEHIRDLRDQELRKSISFRKVQITNIILGNAPGLLSPVVTFAGYAIIVKVSGQAAPSAARIFSSLSLLYLLIDPVNELVGAMPNLSAALDCLNRIQEFVTREKRVDYRTITPAASLNSSAGEDTDPESGQDVIRTNSTKDQGSSVILSQAPNGAEAIVLDRVEARWSDGSIALHDISLRLRSSSLTMIVGSVGSGKSALLKLLLGEVKVLKGSVALTTDEIAYCDQSPFLINGSIRTNVVGFSDFDEKWYHACISACALDVDMNALPEGDQTIVGSKGIILSGGQKQRLALARAVYARKKIVLLDDIFSGLDPETEKHCFHHVIGEQGLLRETGATVVLVTHSVRWLSLSYRILVMGEGTILQSGSYKSLVSSTGFVHELSLRDADSGVSNNAASEPTAKTGNTKETEKKPERSTDYERRGKRDISHLTYYVKSMGVAGFSIFALCVVLDVAFAALQPVWLNWWVQSNHTHPHLNVGVWLAVYALFGILSVFFLGLAGGYVLISLVPKSAKNLHNGILISTMRAPLSHFAATDSGSILNRFTQDMTLVDMQLPTALILASEKFGSTVADAILTCVASGYMAICLPFLAVALYFIQKIYLQTSRQMRLLDLEASSPLFTHFRETLDGLRTIRAFKWTDKAMAQSYTHLDHSQRPFYLLLCLQRWLNLVLDLVIAGLAVILITLAVTLRHRINGSLLGVAMVSIVNFGQTLSYFVNFWTRLETSLGAVARTKQYIADTPTEAEATGQAGPPPWPQDTRIHFRNITAAYTESGPNVLKNVDLQVQAGQRVAVCGRTGSGKSTLIALLLRLIDPKEGTIVIGAQDISSFSRETVRQNLNLLPQEPWFFPRGDRGSVRSNLDPYHQGTDADIIAVLEKTRLLDQVKSMGGLDAEMDAQGGTLSAGQKQLFCLARAMLKRRGSDRGILVLDEATSSVDEHTEELIMGLLRTDFAGWTILSVAHRLKTVLEFDRVAVMDQGRVVEFGGPKELLTDASSAFGMMCKHGTF